MAGFLVISIVVAVAPAGAADPDIVYLRHIEGTVSFSEAGSQAMEAVVNTPLIEGDTIATGPGGRVELFLKDGGMVRIGRNAVMKMIAVDDEGVRFRLDQGAAYIVTQGSREVPLFVDTPLTALDITSPSTVRIDAYSNGIDETSVLKGNIFVSEQRSGRMLVRQGERLVVTADGFMPVVVALRASDDWMRWNVQRDAMTVADTGTSESYAYLPDELRTFSSDLDANGQWIYTPEYNYVWVPTVITVGAWSPYRYGRWVWIRGSYVWIGYEPWGWAPYHYGRWVHHRHAGWCWVPPKHRESRWEPAHVAWVHSSRHVGWIPLGPGERYDRRTAPVIHQVNIYNTTYRHAGARTSCRNASVANSMVTVERGLMLRQKITSVTAVKTGPATLKKVLLPATVTPARPVRSPAHLSITEKNPRPAIAPTRRVTGASPPPVPRQSVRHPQIPERPLNSRIESARISEKKDGGDKTVNDTPSGKSDPRPSPMKMQTQSRTIMGAPAAPGNIARPVQPAVKRGVPVRQADTGRPAHSAHQAARPVGTGRQTSPVVSAAPQPVQALQDGRPSPVRNEPARGPVPQVMNRPPAAPANAVTFKAHQTAARPVPHAAFPAKPAPVQPAKKDAGSAPGKNRRPHT